MGLNYGYTCPDIDKHTVEAKSVIGDHIEALVLELNPWLGEVCNLPEEIQNNIDNVVDVIYSGLEDIFEGVRECNEDMRR